MLEESKQQSLIIPEIPIPDCFVHPLLKLNNGKNGHGERRLYTGDSHINNEYICTKPLKISYPANYKEEIALFLDDASNFTKIDEKRKEKVFAAIDECDGKLIRTLTQNGDKDVRRYYVGPGQLDKTNIRLYDTFRKTLIPKQYTIKLVEQEDCFLCQIIKNELGQTDTCKE
jgi:hypothetical protein